MNEGEADTNYTVYSIHYIHTAIFDLLHDKAAHLSIYRNILRFASPAHSANPPVKKRL